MTTAREKFIGLLRDDILKLDLAELDFGLETSSITTGS